MTNQHLLIAAVALFATAAALSDIRRRKIPNALTVPAAIAGLAFHVLTAGWAGALMSFNGFLVGFALLLIPFVLGGGGGGDVKLLAALGAWLGPVNLLLAFVLGVGLGALLATLALGWSGLRSGAAVKRDESATVAASSPLGSHNENRRTLHGAKPRVLPFAAPMALATYVVLFWMVFKAGVGAL